MSLILEKDPGDVDVFGLDYSSQLPTDDTIVTNNWNVVGGDGILVVDTFTISGKVTKFRASAGTAGQTYVVRNVITTAQGRTLERVLRLAILNDVL